MSSESQDATTEQHSPNDIHVHAVDSLNGAKSTAWTAALNVYTMSVSLGADFKNWTAAKTSTAASVTGEYARSAASWSAEKGSQAAESVADAADEHMGKIAGASILALILVGLAYIYSRD